VVPNVVIHLNNEQPLLADLFEMPAAGDAGLVCTNLRTIDGRRPVFIDRMDATFFFPYLHVRFLEISPVAAAGEAGLPVPVEAPEPEPEPEIELVIDEDFLRRVREA
jgi:hypothetical protein